MTRKPRPGPPILQSHQGNPALQAAAVEAHPLDLAGTPRLEASLEQLILLIEQQLPRMRASVLLLDEDGVTLRHGAAPGLPPAYLRAIDGSRIGPAAGSCGTAAYRQAQVVVEDIAVSPLWVQYRDLALPHGLRACWSTPFFDSRGEVLGTFAMYYGEPQVPTGAEQTLIATATLLASNIVLRARALAALAASEARARAARLAAERANQSKTDFLAKMSHELRTPLNAIGGYAMLMLDGIPDAASPAQSEFLRRIVGAQKHLLGLVDTLLTHAKLEAGQMTYRMEAVEVSGLVESVRDLVAPQIEEKGLLFECSCEETLQLMCDRDRTLQILLNLLSNAAKFTPEGGRVTLETRPEGSGRASIVVRDTGVGMTRDQLDRLFDPFTQFDNALTSRQRGTGLGAPISRELARGMGGELTVRSEPGAGSEFALTLARAAPGDG